MPQAFNEQSCEKYGHSPKISKINQYVENAQKRYSETIQMQSLSIASTLKLISTQPITYSAQDEKASRKG